MTRTVMLSVLIFVTEDRCCLEFQVNVVEQITGPVKKGPL